MSGALPVNPFRAILMLLAAGVAFWQGWRVHLVHSPWAAYGLGVLALALAVWHLMQKPPQPRR
jgi:hypothetical protein